MCVSATIIAQADDLAKPARPKDAASVSGKHIQGTKEVPNSTEQRIERLIRDLGSSQYPARRAAANELRQIGADAFDSLYAATDDPDPEVAASAGYLLRQVPVRWLQSEDSGAVRAIMRQFSQESDAARMQHVEQLGKLPHGAGISALCRIARYDRSPLISRSAALAVIRPSEKSSSGSRIDADVVLRELGASRRAPAEWLRQYLAQLRDPAASIAAWKQLADQESVRLEKNTGDTSSDVVLGLCWNLADVYRQLGDRQALNAMLDRMIGLAAEGSDDTLVNLLTWLAENKSWDALDALIAKHRSRLEQGKRPLYYAAFARAKQGKQDAAEELAAKAAALEPQGRSEGVFLATELQQRSQFNWAVREYRRVIEKQPGESLESIVAQISLAELLHDYQHEKEAADCLEPLVKKVLGEGNMGQLYSNFRKFSSNRDTDADADNDRSYIPSAEEIAAHYHYYRACQYRDEKDRQRSRGELERAIKFDPKDADVLIDMYRLPESEAKWHNAVLEQIHKLVQHFQHKIDENPTDPSAYNQWAWLVSNTEGDFQKAIRYSHRSLELNTHGESAAAGFLDTLGRCYYAAGDYKNAVNYERQAVEKVEYMQVMKRQLALFEKALAQQSPAKSK